MALSLDTVTRAAMDAAATPSAKAQAVLSAIADPATVRVYNGSDTLMGEGTLIAPWATRTGGVLTLGEVSAFNVLQSGTPGAGWYLRVESGTRWLRGTFGPGADFTWSLATFESGALGTIGTVTLTSPSAVAQLDFPATYNVASGSTGAAPIWENSPINLTLAPSAEFNFGQYARDPDLGALTFLIESAPSGYSIGYTTGMLTAGPTSGAVTVRATDPQGLYTVSPPCAVTVQVVQPPAGSIVHGASFTITASQMGVASFGTKTTAAPLLWDDVSGASHLEKWSGAWPDVGNSAYYTQYRNVQRGVSTAHSRATRYIAGSHGDNAGYNAGYNVIPYRAFTAPAFPYYIYASWYQRSDPAWVFGGDNNFKIFDFSYGGTPYTMSSSTRSNWYVSFDGPYSTTAPTAGLLINDDGGSFINPDMNGHNFWWNSATNPMYAWAKVEVEARITNQNDGYLRVWDRSISGTPRVNYVGPTDRYEGTARAIGIGGYVRMSGQPNNWRYFNDAYIDISAARVVLANSANIDTATIVEPQPPTSWNTDSITFTGNLGRLSSGTAYLHVRNSSGAWVNATGYSVQVA